MLYINTHTHTHTYMQRAHRGSVNQTQLPCLSEAHKFASNNFPLFFSLPPQPFLFPIFSLAFFGKVNSVGGKKRGAEVHLCWSFSISLPHVRWNWSGYLSHNPLKWITLLWEIPREVFIHHIHTYMAIAWPIKVVSSRCIHLLVNYGNNECRNKFYLLIVIYTYLVL